MIDRINQAVVEQVKSFEDLNNYINHMFENLYKFHSHLMSVEILKDQKNKELDLNDLDSFIKCRTELLHDMLALSNTHKDVQESIIETIFYCYSFSSLEIKNKK